MHNSSLVASRVTDTFECCDDVLSLLQCHGSEAIKGEN